MDEARVRFRVLGRLEVEVGGAPVALGAVKQQLVLAVLLARANAVTPVETLIDTLWPDGAPRTGRKNIQVYVANIRKLLGPAGIDRIAFGIGGYRLTARPEELDALEFTELVAEGRRVLTTAGPSAAAAHLARALRLWRGPALEGLAQGPVLTAWTEHLHRLHPAAVEDWGESELAAGNAAAAVDRIGEVAARHPFRERLRGVQMTALWQCGRQGEALAAFDELRQALARELGLEPGAALQRLYRQVLAGDQEERASVDLMPAGTPDFVGRAYELERLRTLLRPGTVTVISGPGGAGKTALALRAARLLGDRFPDGRILVPLRRADGRLRDGDEIRSELADSVGTQDPATWLREHRLLLVLDGASPHTPIPAGVLPTSLGRCALVVTGRPRLAGTRLELGGFTVGEAVTLLRRVSGRLSLPDEVAERIVAAVGLFPAAIEGAGRKLLRLRHLPAGEWAERLTDPAGLLGHLDGETDLAGRITAELAVLAEADRDAVRALATLPGRMFTLGEAGAVLGEEALYRLERLIEHDLVTAPEAEVSAHEAGYELPALLYSYLRQQQGA